MSIVVAGADFDTLTGAMHQTLVPPHNTYRPEPENVAVHQKPYDIYERIYFSFGQRNSRAVDVGDVLPELRRIASEVRQQKCG